MNKPPSDEFGLDDDDEDWWRAAEKAQDEFGFDDEDWDAAEIAADPAGGCRLGTESSCSTGQNRLILSNQFDRVFRRGQTACKQVGAAGLSDVEKFGIVCRMMSAEIRQTIGKDRLRQMQHRQAG